MHKARIKTFTEFVNQAQPEIHSLLFKDQSRLSTTLMGSEVCLQSASILPGFDYQAVFNPGTGNEFMLEVKSEWLTDIKIDWSKIKKGQVCRFKHKNKLEESREFIGVFIPCSRGDFTFDLTHSCPYHIDSQTIKDWDVALIS